MILSQTDIQSTARPQVGHAEIDEQHAQLHGKLELLSSLVLSKANRAPAIACLRELIMDFGMHFGFEEALMQESGYPGSEHHLRQHVGIMTEVGLLLDSLEDDAAVSNGVRVADFIASWYGRHFDQSDREFIAWLGQRNPARG